MFCRVSVRRCRRTYPCRQSGDSSRKSGSRAKSRPATITDEFRAVCASSIPTKRRPRVFTRLVRRPSPDKPVSDPFTLHSLSGRALGLRHIAGSGIMNASCLVPPMWRPNMRQFVQQQNQKYPAGHTTGENQLTGVASASGQRGPVQMRARQGSKTHDGKTCLARKLDGEPGPSADRLSSPHPLQKLEIDGARL